MSYEAVKYYVERIGQNNERIFRLKDAQRKLLEKINEQVVIFSIVEENCSGITNIHPRDLSRILDKINAYIKRNKHEFTYSYWDTEVAEIPEPWEDWSNYNLLFNVYGVRKDKHAVTNSNEYKKLEEDILVIEEDTKQCELIIIGMLK